MDPTERVVITGEDDEELVYDIPTKYQADCAAIQAVYEKVVEAQKNGASSKRAKDIREGLHILETGVQFDPCLHCQPTGRKCVRLLKNQRCAMSRINGQPLPRTRVHKPVVAKESDQMSDLTPPPETDSGGEDDNAEKGGAKMVGTTAAAEKKGRKTKPAATKSDALKGAAQMGDAAAGAEKKGSKTKRTPKKSDAAKVADEKGHAAGGDGNKGAKKKTTGTAKKSDAPKVAEQKDGVKAAGGGKEKDTTKVAGGGRADGEVTATSAPSARTHEDAPTSEGEGEAPTKNTKSPSRKEATTAPRQETESDGLIDDDDSMDGSNLLIADIRARLLPAVKGVVKTHSDDFLNKYLAERLQSMLDDAVLNTFKSTAVQDSLAALLTRLLGGPAGQEFRRDVAKMVSADIGSNTATDVLATLSQAGVLTVELDVARRILFDVEDRKDGRDQTQGNERGRSSALSPNSRVEPSSLSSPPSPKRQRLDDYDGLDADGPKQHVRAPYVPSPQVASAGSSRPSNKRKEYGGREDSHPSADVARYRDSRYPTHQLRQPESPRYRDEGREASRYRDEGREASRYRDEGRELARQSYSRSTGTGGRDYDWEYDHDSSPHHHDELHSHGRSRSEAPRHGEERYSSSRPKPSARKSSQRRIR